MSDSPSGTDELNEIREKKRQELLGEGGEGDADAASPSGTPNEPVFVESQDHYQELIAEHDVVLVDFYADWCGPCKMIEPTVEAIAADTDAVVAKVDIDQHQMLAQQQGVRGVPTLAVYAGGEPAQRFVGVQDESTLRSAVTELGA